MRAPDVCGIRWCDYCEGVTWHVACHLCERIVCENLTHVAENVKTGADARVCEECSPGDDLDDEFWPDMQD